MRRKVCHTRPGGDKLLLRKHGQREPGAAGCTGVWSDGRAILTEQLPALWRARPVRMRGPPPPSAGPDRGRRVVASEARRLEAESRWLGAVPKEKVGAEPGSGGGPWRAGGDGGESDTGLTVEQGRGLTDRPPPCGSYTRSGSGRASLPRLSERRVRATVMAAVARTAPVEPRSER